MVGKGKGRSQKQMEAGGEGRKGTEPRKGVPGMRRKDLAREYLLPGHFRPTFFSRGLLNLSLGRASDTKPILHDRDPFSNFYFDIVSNVQKSFKNEYKTLLYTLSRYHQLLAR